METQKWFSILNYLVVLFVFGLLFSCEQLAPVEEPVAVLEEFQDLSGLTLEPEDDPMNARLIYTSDCESDCIEPGSGNYFAIRDSKSQSSGINTKKVSYKAYNTEDKFVVKVKYEVTSGPSQAKVSIAIQINGKKKEFKAVPSGYTATFSIPLDEGWDKCDQVTFSILQKGLGSPISFSEKYNLIPVCEDFYLGQEYGGGIIAYILQPGDQGYDPDRIHGLIAAKEDQSIGVQWGCEGVELPNADGFDVGTGYQNTLDILSECPVRPIAASVAKAYQGGGFTDWFLPSLYELEKLWQNKNLIRGFSNEIYWSSTEGGYIWDGSWGIAFDDGYRYDDGRPALYRVRAVRTF
jgi:hypothetical protein